MLFLACQYLMSHPKVENILKNSDYYIYDSEKIENNGHSVILTNHT